MKEPNTMETHRLTSAQDNATGEYRQLDYVRTEDQASRMVQIWFLVFITFVVAIAFFFLAWNFGKVPSSFRIGLPEIVVGFIVFAATLIAQLWMHVLILRSYGAKPDVGVFRNGIVYIAVPGYGLRRNSVIVAALAPLVVLTALSLIGMWLLQASPWAALFALIGAVNIGVSTSHLWAIVTLLRYPSSAWTVDDGQGMRILLPMGDK
jgi:hypothetical protein